jgi:chitinase
MNGRSDTGEIFTQSDFQTMLSFAQSNGMSRFTFWSVNRDRECNPPDNNGTTSSECSSVTQNPWDFTAYTVAFANGASAPYTSGDLVSTTATSGPNQWKELRRGARRRLLTGRPGPPAIRAMAGGPG